MRTSVLCAFRLHGQTQQWAQIAFGCAEILYDEKGSLHEQEAWSGVMESRSSVRAGVYLLLTII
jgi:hypothetical protein